MARVSRNVPHGISKIIDVLHKAPNSKESGGQIPVVLLKEKKAIAAQDRVLASPPPLIV